MNIEKICQSNVMGIDESSIAKEAIDLMDAGKVGALVVMGNDGQPTGIITDRDIAIKIVGENRSAETPVKEIMSTDLLAVSSDQEIDEVLQQMQEKAVRRAPVVDENNKIIGFVSMDDILIFLAEELGALAGLVRKQLFI